MGKTLIIAEKPSVARDIAQALGGFKKTGEWLERDDAIVSSAIGHLVELTVDERKEDAFNMASLPIIPDEFKLSPVDRTKSQLKVLKDLMARSDVDCVANACDAGREGELIFRYIYRYAKCRKRMKRLWLQSMTQAAIKDAWRTAKDGSHYDNLYHAAQSRSEADWIVGINASRGLSLRAQAVNGVWETWSAGRVQTPTLALLVDRENEIRSFVPKDYFEVQATFRAAAGDYKAKWFNPAFRKNEDEPEKTAERLFDKASAEAIATRCRGGQGFPVTDKTTPAKKAPPKLFDLTSLQREANVKFSMSAKATLAAAQALYETHKVLTYPRTDSCHLPSDYVENAKKAMTDIADAFSPWANAVLSNGWIRPNKAIFDDAKISDHFAIIPTGVLPGGQLSKDEERIFDLVAKRFIAAFHPAAEFLQTERITVVGKDSFKSTGKILVVEGWLAVYGKAAAKEEDEPALVPVKAGEKPAVAEIKAAGLKTKPPSRYTEATLLGAMEHAGRFVDDESLKEALGEKGLGTPATRAAIIEGLLSAKKNYVVREKKELVPTSKGMDLIAKLRNLGIEALTHAQLTGEWEHKLKLMEQGKFDRDAFMTEISDTTRQAIAKIRADTSTFNGTKGARKMTTLDTACPVCGGPLELNDKLCKCGSCEFKIWREIASKKLTDAQIKALLSDGKTGPIDGFKGKTGKVFSASLKLEDGKVSFDFGAANVETSLVCPACKSGKLIDEGKRMTCSCGFVLWKTVAGKDLSNSQIAELVKKGRTEVISGFVSRAGKAFSAALKMEDGKAVFEFPERSEGGGGGGGGGGSDTGVKCPACKAAILEREKGYFCSGCKFKVWKEIAKRPVSVAEMRELVSKGRTAKLSGFTSKVGKPFNAVLKLEGTDVQFDFS